MPARKLTIPRIIAFLFCSMGFLQVACGLSPAVPTVTPADLASSPVLPTQTTTLVPAPSATQTNTSLPTQTLTPTPSPTFTSSPTITSTITPVPTYVKLRAEVIIDQAVCHYGPGAPYLYKYGVYKGSNLEIIHRLEGGNYVEVQAIRGNNPCWVREDYFKIKGNLADVEPVFIDDVKLPISPYYASPGGASARRDGNVVTVFWNALNLRPGDDSLQTPYIIEAWVCQGGQMVFVPAGSRGIAVKITDEPGCSSPSHAWFIAAEKHGYTPRIKVPWPQANETPAALPTATP